eukprot:c29365_g2_i3 orf=721-5196(+)
MSRPSAIHQLHQKAKRLNDKYLLGDEIGKGAYGRVYKGLDLENGDFVAIKQVSLDNIPPEDLASIMQEIDLLKNLNHKNIVKYLGSIKTKSHLYIILEYVENGSLANIIKPNKFGAFPESLVAVYIAQVLEGLVYLHEQGVIHRDIKGANILTTKEGLVKLADFGVATKLTEADVNTHSVVGTPYWMAPEVIEMSGVSSASDIWSVGCTVIELLTCVPPYYDLQPMPALFRIVQDEHPPIPEHLSPAITDFLHQCFRKDGKLRPDAKTLLKHPWIQNSRRALHSSLQRSGGELKIVPEDVPLVVENSVEGGEKDLSMSASQDLVKGNTAEFGLDEEVKFNYPTKIASTSAISSGVGQNSIANSHQVAEHLVGSKDHINLGITCLDEFATTSSEKLIMRHETASLVGISAQPPECVAAVSSSEIHGVAEGVLSISGSRKKSNMKPNLSDVARGSSSSKGEEQEDAIRLLDSSQTIMRREVKLPNMETNSSHYTVQTGKLSGLSSAGELSKFSDTPADGMLDDLFEESSIQINYSSTEGACSSGSVVPTFQPIGSLVSTENGKTNLAAKLKEKMAQKRVEGERAVSTKKNGEDFFSAIINAAKEDGIDITDLGFENKVEGPDIQAKQAVEVARLIGVLKPDESEDAVIKACHRLVAIFHEHADQKSHLISQHGVMPFVEMLEVKNNRVLHAVLQVINELAKDNPGFLENVCLVGLIPVIISFGGPECSKEMRIQAADFVQQLCQTSAQTLQMFIACRGLPVLVGFLEPDYAKYREMVHMAINGMWQVLKLHGSTPRNVFCRLFAGSGVLIRLVNTLHSLNEATRLASAVGMGSGSATTENGSHRSRSGPLVPSRAFSGNIEAFRPRSGQLDSSHVHSGYCDRSSNGLVETFRPQSCLFQRNHIGQMESRHTPVAAPAHVDQTQAFPNLFEQVISENGRSSGQQDQPLLFRIDREQFDFGHLGQPETTPVDADQSRPLLGNADNSRSLLDQSWQPLDLMRSPNGLYDSANSSYQQKESVQPLISLLEKDPSSRPVSGQLEYIRHLQGGLERHESILPLLHHASAVRKTNGELELLMSAFEDNGKDNGVIEMAQSNLGSNLSPTPSSRISVQAAGGHSMTGDPTMSTSGFVSQPASGILSVSGVLGGRAGSVTSSGFLSRMVSTLNADVAREYLEKVADLLLEFSRADTVVKSHMCKLSLLIRLFQMLNKLEPTILLRILKCINQLSTDPFTLEHLQRADAMKHLVPFFEWREGPMVSQIHNEVLNALYNLCKINKRRQEQAAECGIIPHLMHFIKINSPLKQLALPLLCDMAHASRCTREQLRAHKGIELYLSLLDDEDWAVTALDSLAVCLALDNEQRKVEQALLKPEAIHKLVGFFQARGEESFVDILEPFLKVITKSSRINVHLATSGLTPLLVARLDHQDAIARLNLLKLIKAVYEHHPRPKQLIVEYSLPEKLQRLIEERRDGEHSGGQVLVKQMATSLLKALHINTVL